MQELTNQSTFKLRNSNAANSIKPMSQTTFYFLYKFEIMSIRSVQVYLHNKTKVTHKAPSSHV